ncbi:MAG TPA: flavoprotein, partial [Candidatus Poseidoniales archaeon]|nr:flavoprotein [Candidatus Poseidoniales archaeon]
MTASIAIHRSLDVASELRKSGVVVSVVMTPNATRLIQPLMFQSMAHGAVYVDPFEVVPDFEHGHIRLAREGDL